MSIHPKDLVELPEELLWKNSYVRSSSLANMLLIKKVPVTLGLGSLFNKLSSNKKLTNNCF